MRHGDFPIFHIIALGTGIKRNARYFAGGRFVDGVLLQLVAARADVLDNFKTEGVGLAGLDPVVIDVAVLNPVFGGILANGHGGNNDDTVFGFADFNGTVFAVGSRADTVSVVIKEFVSNMLDGVSRFNPQRDFAGIALLNRMRAAGINRRDAGCGERCIGSAAISSMKTANRATRCFLTMITLPS